MLKIALIAVGNPCRSTTWSGVPNNLFRELERNGYEVYPLDISADFMWHWCGVAFNRVLRKIYKPWHRVHFCNTKFALWLSRRWLKREIDRVGGVDMVFSTSFSVDLREAGVPAVMLHDWTEGYGILRSGTPFLNRCEKQSEQNQLDLIVTCDLVVVLYPRSRKYLAETCGGCYDKIKYFCNPVNALPLTEELLNERMAICSAASREVHLLVVGGAWYQQNVEYVIQAADRLSDDNIVVDVVGRNSAVSKPSHCKVVFHGYLNKDKEGDRQKYDALFVGAKCLVNIRLGWGAGSSAAEAMYKYVPVIIGKYPDIEAMYGEAEGRFGLYCTPGDVDDLVVQLRKLLSMSPVEYTRLCQSAHEITKNDTYENLVSSILANVGI